MGEIDSYICKECGWEIGAAPGGVDVLMNGGVSACFYCPECRDIVECSLDFYREPNSLSKHVCPICGCENLEAWDPERGFCPRCGGELKNEGLLCLND